MIREEKYNQQIMSGSKRVGNAEHLETVLFCYVTDKKACHGKNCKEHLQDTNQKVHFEILDLHATHNLGVLLVSVCV